MLYLKSIYILSITPLYPKIHKCKFYNVNSTPKYIKKLKLWYNYLSLDYGSTSFYYKNSRGLATFSDISKQRMGFCINNVSASNLWNSRLTLLMQYPRRLLVNVANSPEFL